ncbi:MAG: AAA family ATPase [Planctomycetaceae bacterium]|jgi:MoxR-like ATPase|nr:AAA family ATPase [Planctomycetaceae bacterium]|tara:strand:- start:4377 stop:5417 length:1041 start_codon:yes stop_codon:yes gene_type:complete
MSDENQTTNDGDVTAVESWAQKCQDLRTELQKSIIGQDEVIEQVLIAILARGHALLEGVPGLAKTLMISSIAEALTLSFHRIQFTPDLMPSDITGTDVLREDPVTKEREYAFVQGPIFANMILADEINRTPPKTQAAMLEAMQERIISAGGKTHKLPAPFFVLATQNPLEQEGTYPLPEAQLDRFLLYIKVGYPTAAEEWDIARKVSAGALGGIESVISAEEIIEAQALTRRMPVCDQVLGYAHALVRATRPGTEEAPDFVNESVGWGAGPRGVLSLISCAKARALLKGRYHTSVEDVQAIVLPALRHRIAPNYAGMASGLDSEKLLELLLEAVPADQTFNEPVAV